MLFRMLGLGQKATFGSPPLSLEVLFFNDLHFLAKIGLLKKLESLLKT